MVVPFGKFGVKSLALLTHDMESNVELCYGVLVDKLLYNFLSLYCVLESLLDIRDLITVDPFLGATRI